jgi:hypothetical protein
MSGWGLRRAQWIKSLIEDLGVNLAGVEMIIRMSLRMEALEEEVEALRRRVTEEHAAPEAPNSRKRRG